MTVVLDTNVVSELLKTSPDPTVLAWSRMLQQFQVAITSITVMEVRHGIARMPAGRRREALTSEFDDFCSKTVGGVLVFDQLAAEETAEYLARRERAGRPLVDVRDAQIAGIVLSLTRRSGRSATLATRNVSDFASLRLLNPWSA